MVLEGEVEEMGGYMEHWVVEEARVGYLGHKVAQVVAALVHVVVKVEVEVVEDLGQWEEEEKEGR